MSEESILLWLENNYNEKVLELKKKEKEILEKKEMEFKDELISKSHDYRDVKFGNIMNENKIDINNLLQKFRYNKDLLIEKKISEVIQIAKDSIKELIDTQPAFLIFYYSNLINFILKNFPDIKKIYCPCQTEKFFSQFKIKNQNLKLIGSEDIEIGIIGEVDKKKTLIHFSPEIMYENNCDEIRNTIFQILMEP